MALGIASSPPGPAAARSSWTGWEVPVLSMKTPLTLKLSKDYRWWADSAVTVYWPERPLAPSGKRVVRGVIGMALATTYFVFVYRHFVGKVKANGSGEGY